MRAYLEYLDRTKTCVLCGLSKPTKAFYCNPKTADQFDSSCKECRKRRHKKFYEKNAERLRREARLRNQDPEARRRKREYAKDYRKKNHDKVRASEAKTYAKNKEKYNRRCRDKKYGLKEGEFERLLEEQNRRCATCFEEVKLVVDHDNETGEVRGLICSECNLALGLVKDDVATLLRMVGYLNE